MNTKEYKKYHEDHMMHNNGTTLGECVVLLSTIPFCVFLSSYLSSYITKTTSYTLEFLLIILPMVLNCTVFSDFNHIIFLNVILLCTSIIFMKVDSCAFKNFLNSECRGRKSFISNYRASTNFISALCILAVDFVVFPKRLAKTETFGYGFMDLGVGCFICSNGFVEKYSVTKSQFNKLIKTELTLCSLGLIRMLSVKSIDYHEHVSEYGVHWNFFLTLAVCRLMSHFIIFLTNDGNLVCLSVIVGLLHQGLLLLVFQEWVLSNVPRDSFVSANREGLVSCLGYVSLFFAASAVGKFFTNKITYKKLLLRLVLVCIFCWLGLAISLKVVSVSRRLCNISYILWIMALSLTELILFVILEVSLMSLNKEKEVKNFITEPTILKTINRYGLFFFIFSNLLTGCVNLIFQTLLLGKILSMIIIIIYMLILCTTTYVLHLKNFVFYY